jgi:hypothetical protein
MQRYQFESGCSKSGFFSLFATAITCGLRGKGRECNGKRREGEEGGGRREKRGGKREERGERR